MPSARSLLAGALACAASLPLLAAPAQAQGGPPPEVADAVRRVVRMLESTDRASLERFVDEALAPAYREAFSPPDLLAHLDALRAYTRGATGDLRLMRTPDGLRMGFEGDVALALELDAEYRVARLERAEDGGEVVMEGPPEPVDLDLGDDWTSLDELLRRALDATGAPGVAAAVVQGGRIVDVARVGTRQAGTDAPLRPGDRFHWGSVGKSATGTVIGALMDQGLLTPHTTVEDVLGDVPMRDAYRNVTLAQLMRHEGGVQPYTEFEGETIDRFMAYRGTPTEKRAAFVADLLMEEPIHRPGERFTYSNGGVSLAGHMAERVAGRSWEELVRTYVFEPAGMDGATFGYPATEETPDQPRGHFVMGPDEIEVVPIGAFGEIDPMIAPAGGISSSVEDFARYAAFHLRGLRDGTEALSRDAFRRLHTPDPASHPVRNGTGRYTWGWEVTEWPVPGVETHWHNGSGGTFYAELRLVPEEDLALVIMANGAGAIAFSGDQVLEALYRRYGARPVPAPDAPLTWDNLEARLVQAERGGFSGVALVRRGGRQVLRRAFGLADRASQRPSDLDDAYGIGSAPISFTTTAALLLASRGDLDLDAPVARYLDGVPDDKRTLTAAMILDGRSGLPDFHDLPGDRDPDLAWIDRAEAERRILSQPLLFPPGTDEAHSHSAYVLLAAIVERVSGVPYPTFVRQEILEPLGMDRTGFYGESLGLTVDDFAVGNGPSSVGVPNIPPNWGPTSWLVMGSGGMFSTLDDMTRYRDALAAGTLLPGAWADRQRGWAGTVDGSDRGFFGFRAANRNGDEITIMTNVQEPAGDIGSLIRPVMELVLRR